MGRVRRIAKSVLVGVGVDRLARTVNRHRAAILMYHGLSEDRGCTEWTQVQRSTFERQMADLRATHRVVHLRELVERLRAGSVEARCAAVTFDDGYRSVAHLAAPILRRMEIPAAIFLTSDFIADTEGEHRYLWPDEVRVLVGLWREPTLDLGPFGLPAYDLRGPAAVRRASSRLTQALKTVPNRVRGDVVEVLRTHACGGSLPAPRPEHVPMTWADAGRLAADPLFEIGAHTRTHPILSQTPTDALESEIVGGKQAIERRLGIDVSLFAYPNGRQQDFDERSVALARTHFAASVTTIPGLNAPGTDLHALLRVGIGGDTDAAGFRLLVSGAVRG